jgi:hypothetical protein
LRIYGTWIDVVVVVVVVVDTVVVAAFISQTGTVRALVKTV